jgi:dethiobiotin synthase
VWHLSRRFAARHDVGAVGEPVRYWKPIQTGTMHDDDTAEIRRLVGGSEGAVFDKGLRFAPPVSPHLAARMAGTSIRLSVVVNLIRREPPSARWIVEGAGGALVPINESDLMVDLMRCLDLPVLVVARPTLGTINHTLLTLEALRARQLRVAGVLLVGEPNIDNQDAIAHYGQVAVLGTLPPLQPLTPSAVEQACTTIDPDGRLAEAFQ